MKVFYAFLVFFVISPAWAANQCRQPLEKLLRSAEEIAAKYGADCLTAVKKGSTTTGERARAKCKQSLGKENFDRQAAVLRKIYDTAVHVCANDCEGTNLKHCKKALSDLVPYGTSGVKNHLRKIHD